VRVPGDGACLFSAVFVCLYHDRKGVIPDSSSERFRRAVQRLRVETVQYVIEHWDWPLGGVRGNPTGGESVDMEYFADPECPEIEDRETYQAHMSQRKTYGGQTELQALSALLNCGIVVHPSNDECQWESGVFFCSRAGAKNVARRYNVGRRPVLHLSLDENIRHYEAILGGKTA
jgi:hypothetical protein